MTAGQRPERPDYRFTLANERTFLAWIRTSLGLLAASVGVDQLATNLGSSVVREVLAAALAVAAAAMGCLGFQRWRVNQRAIDAGTPLASGRPLLVMALAITAVAAVLVVVYVVRGS
ncbi:MAG: YidH family protein [Nocardioidaceae bacterium]